MTINRYGAGNKYARLEVLDKYIQGKRVNVDVHLGVCVVFEANLFYKRNLGLYCYDEYTQMNLPINNLCDIPEKYRKQANKIYTDKQLNDIIIEYINIDSEETKDLYLSFGQEFLLFEFLYTSGYITVINSLSYSNKDTIITLVIANILMLTSSEDINFWYKNSVIRYLCPLAEISSQKISECYKALGSGYEETNLFVAQREYLFNYCNFLQEFNLDSIGIGWNTSLPLGAAWNHEGDKGFGIRIQLVDHYLGIPSYFRITTGNINDVSTFPTTKRHMDNLGYNIEKVTFDSGYYSATNTDCCYDEENKLKLDYLTRMHKNNRILTNELQNLNYNIKSSENLFRYNNKIFFIKCIPVKVGTKNDKPASLYVIFDCIKYHKDMTENSKKLFDHNLNSEQYVEAEKKAGFFGLISGTERPCSGVIEDYYKRLPIEQTFYFLINYTGLMPVRMASESTLRGKLSISFMSLSIVRILQLDLKSLDLDFKTFLRTFQTQKCKVYTDNIVVDDVIPAVNQIFKKLNIKIPDQINIVNGIATYEHSEIPSKPKWVNNVLNLKTSTFNGFVQFEESNKKGNSSEENRGKNKDKIQCNKTEKNQEENINKNISADKPSKNYTVGRPIGSRNQKTIARENLVNILYSILDKKCEEQNLSKEEVFNDLKNKEINKKSTRGRKPNSKNNATLRNESVEESVNNLLERSAEELDISKEEMIKLTISYKTSQSDDENTDNQHQRGRKKGSVSEDTLKERKIESTSKYLIQMRSSELEITEDEYVTLITGIEKTLKYTPVHKQKRTLRKDAIKKSTLDQYDLCANELGISRDELIRLKYEVNSKNEETTPIARKRGRRIGSISNDTMQRKEIKSSIDCILKIRCDELNLSKEEYITLLTKISL